MNTLAYILYLGITYWVTVHVGLRCYRYGRVYMLTLFQNDAMLTDTVNRLLLLGYYLLNLGYAAVMLYFWKPVTNRAELLAGVGSKTGIIVLTLALIHFGNMAVIWLAGQRMPHIQQECQPPPTDST